jgi:propionyl-CoA carboxylase beta chain
VIAWPHAEMAAMGVETAVDLVYRRDVDSSADPQARREQLIEEISDRIGVIHAAEAFGVDAIIRPSETRAWLLASMATLPRRRLMETLTPRRHAVTPL